MPVSRTPRRKKLAGATTKARSKGPRDEVRRVYRAHMTGLAERMLGVEATSFSFPGGSRRDSCRMTLADNRSVIATVREEPMRADLEERVLLALAPHGAPAPRVLASNRRVLVQEDVGEQRLSVALHEAGRRGDGGAVMELMRTALGSLHALQSAGHAAGLSERVPLLGVDDGWIEALIDRPRALGQLLGVIVPRADVSTLRDLLSVLDPRFVKWDARPANAAVNAAGEVSWIDFEHCGARNPLDDVAWLIADEYVPLDPRRDIVLMGEWGDRFGGSLPPALLPHYLWTMAMLHGTHRLNLMVNSRLNREEWRDSEKLVARDSVGASMEFAERQCDRLAHFARQSSLVADFAPFYETCRYALTKL